MADYDLVTAGGIPYTLLAGFPKFNCKQDQITGTEHYKMLWSNAVAFATESFNYSYAGASLYLPLPRTMPGNSALYTESIEIEPFDTGLPGGTSEPTYCTVARVTINYSTLKFQETNSVEKNTNVGGEFLEVNTLNASWASATSGRPIKQQDGSKMGLFMPTFDHTMSWSRVLTIPENTLRSLAGKVNSTTFYGAPAETILFAGYSAVTKYTISGAISTINLKFPERPTNWNKFPNFERDAVAPYEYAFFPNGQKMFQSGDLNLIFA